MRQALSLRRSGGAGKDCGKEKIPGMKRIFLLILFFGLLMGTWGCGGSSETMKKTDRMMTYIRAKYPEDSFTFLRISGGHLGSRDTKILVKSEKFPDHYVRVTAVEDKGIEYFYDTYLGVKFEEDTRIRLREILAGSYGKTVFLFYTPDDLSCTENGSDQTSLEEYMAAWSSHISFTAAVIIPEDFSKERETETLKELFSGMALKGSIYYFAPETGIGDLPDGEVLRMIREKAYSAAFDFLERSPGEYRKTEWRG